MMAGAPSIVVAVPTFRRPERLSRLLPQIADEITRSQESAQIVVVDNDPDRSAEPIAHAAQVGYVHEPAAGIGHTRKRALALGDNGSLVIMLDDDLRPDPGWFAGLLSTWRDDPCEVVVGHVNYEWPSGTPDWIKLGGFMRRDLHPRGATLASLATGNVLFDVPTIRRRGVDFDPSLGLHGGEDSLFGEQLLTAGGRIIAAPDSVATELIPSARATRDFVERRTIAHGEGRVALRLRTLRGPRLLLARCVALVGGAVRWVAFTAMRALGSVTGNVQRAAVARRRAWFAVGRMRAATGRRIAEYARPN